MSLAVDLTWDGALALTLSPWRTVRSGLGVAEPLLQQDALCLIVERSVQAALAWVSGGVVIVGMGCAGG